MGKAAKSRHSADDPVLDYFPAFDARSHMVTSMVGVGWRLALTVLIPVFIGIWADAKFETEPSLTLAAFFLAIFGSSVVIARMYKELNDQAKEMKFNKPSKKVMKAYEEDDDNDY
ncbi:MAG: AtpZ/AtpI family protein [bacterium]|nr:AtpZ/AtpI family protein [bacterium]